MARCTFILGSSTSIERRLPPSGDDPSDFDMLNLTNGLTGMERRPNGPLTVRVVLFRSDSMRGLVMGVRS